MRKKESRQNLTKRNRHSHANVNIAGTLKNGDALPGAIATCIKKNRTIEELKKPQNFVDLHDDAGIRGEERFQWLRPEVQQRGRLAVLAMFRDEVEREIIAHGCETVAPFGQ